MPVKRVVQVKSGFREPNQDPHLESLVREMPNQWGVNANHPGWSRLATHVSQIAEKSILGDGKGLRLIHEGDIVTGPNTESRIRGALNYQSSDRQVSNQHNPVTLREVVARNNTLSIPLRDHPIEIPVLANLKDTIGAGTGSYHSKIMIFGNAAGKPRVALEINNRGNSHNDAPYVRVHAISGDAVGLPSHIASGLERLLKKLPTPNTPDARRVMPTSGAVSSHIPNSRIRITSTRLSRQVGDLTRALGQEQDVTERTAGRAKIFENRISGNETELEAANAKIAELTSANTRIATLEAAIKAAHGVLKDASIQTPAVKKATAHLAEHVTKPK